MHPALPTTTAIALKITQLLDAKKQPSGPWRERVSTGRCKICKNPAKTAKKTCKICKTPLQPLLPSQLAGVVGFIPDPPPPPTPAWISFPLSFSTLPKCGWKLTATRTKSRRRKSLGRGFHLNHITPVLVKLED